MRSKWIVVLSIGVFVWTGLAFSEESETTNFTGIVTGTDGTPIEGATLKLYQLAFDQSTYAYSVRLVGEMTSDVEGKFAFSIVPDKTSGYMVFSCLAQKKGLSFGWASASMTKEATWSITLKEPEKMIGFVQDPDGIAVPEAEVRLVMLGVAGREEDGFMFGIEPIDAFVTKTCSDGRFEFDNLPEGSSAEFLVKKTGKGTLVTFTAGSNPAQGLTYKAGETDIRLTLQDGCKVSGVVMNQDSQEPVEGIAVITRGSQSPFSLTDCEPVLSAADGMFEITDLAPGEYTLMIHSDDWIAKPVQLDVQSDMGAKIELTKGGMLEVKVIDSETKEPVSNVQVNMRCDETQQYQHAVTDESGMIKKQLLAGTYRISAYKQGARSLNDAATTVVNNDQTSEVTIELAGQPKIAGTVTDMEGEPVEGAMVHLVPGWGPQRGEIKTDEKGQFTLEWDPGRMGWTEGEFYLIATHADTQLAGVVQIDEDAKEATIKLEKGFLAKGKVVNQDGKPIVGAKIVLYFRGSNFGSPCGMETQSSVDGEYTFGPLATDQRYSVNVQKADGYGTGQQEVQPIAGDTADLAVKDIVLRVADQKVTGQVVDIDGKGLADVQLHCYGNGQPNLNAKTDSEGNFTLENVCSGEIQISANYRNGNEYQYGNVRTEGGAEDVKIIVASQGGGQRFVQRKPASLVGQPLPDLSEYDVEISADANTVIVFVWDMNQRPSRHFMKELAGKMEMLKEKEVTVVLLDAAPVEKEKLDGWLKDNHIDYPCGIITGDIEDVKFKMGVQGLPWLILTDADRKVIAEGFEVEDLEKKLDSE